MVARTVDFPLTADAVTVTDDVAGMKRVEVKGVVLDSLIENIEIPVLLDGIGRADALAHFDNFLPCPFCGDTPNDVEEDSFFKCAGDNVPTATYWVECRCGVKSRTGRTRTEGIAKWNTRA